MIDPPVCKVCRQQHWPRDPHVLPKLTYLDVPEQLMPNATGASIPEAIDAPASKPARRPVTEKGVTNAGVTNAGVTNSKKGRPAKQAPSPATLRKRRQRAKAKA